MTKELKEKIIEFVASVLKKEYFVKSKDICEAKDKLQAFIDEYLEDNGIKMDVFVMSLDSVGRFQLSFE